MSVYRKYIYCIIISILLLSMAIFGFLFPDPQEEKLIFTVGNGETKIETFEGEDGCIYACLPSYASMNDVRISSAWGGKAKINGTAVSNGQSCRDLELGTWYDLQIGNGVSKRLQFCQSANVATLYIDTISKGMEYIHESKDHQEVACVTLYTKDGDVELIDRQATLKGRGNSTWYGRKKAYNVSLSRAADVLGMEAGLNWTLLGNNFDETNLRNKLVYDFAKDMGMEWIPGSEYVDVYFNGVYNGLYLLTERLEVGTERLNIDTKNGDFLLNTDLENRWDGLKNPFHSSIGRTIEISAPADLSGDEKRRIEEQVAALEETFLTQKDLRNAKNIDLDSWVIKYLIDEIFCNSDADLASDYFYCKQGVFYAGPVWDYDAIMGSNSVNGNPNAFCAKNYIKYGSSKSEYYSVLYNNPSFFERVVHIYQEECLPLLEKLIQGKIMQLSASLETASNMNFVRWPYKTAEDRDRGYRGMCEALVDYLQQRVAFLNRAWIDQIQYCTVQVEPYLFSQHQCFSVEKGKLLETEAVNLETCEWIIEKTGEPFDSQMPIMEDMVLLPVINDTISTTTETEEAPALNVLITGVSLAGMILLLGLFIVVDIHNRKTMRR